MSTKWSKRDQKLVQRQKHKDQRKFFNDKSIKKRKIKQFMNEKDYDNLKKLSNGDGDVYEDGD